MIKATTEASCDNPPIPIPIPNPIANALKRLTMNLVVTLFFAVLFKLSNGVVFIRGGLGFLQQSRFCFFLVSFLVTKLY